MRSVLVILKSGERPGRSPDQGFGLLHRQYQYERFLQALEGPINMVEAAFDRIRSDDRHRGVVVLSRREIETREFGAWEMAIRQPGADGDNFIESVAPLLSSVSPNIRGTFEGFCKVKRLA